MIHMKPKKICEWCKKEIKDIKSNRQKYHLKTQPNMDRSCSEYARLEKKTIKYNRTYNKKVNNSFNTELGSKDTGLKNKLPDNSLKAHRLILAEFKRLGLHRKGFGLQKKYEQ
jgi:hypothetical protein